MTAKKSTKKPNNAFEAAADILGTGVDALFNDQDTMLSVVPLEDIAVKEQIRASFEDEENTLEELAASIRQHGVLQPILVRLASGSLPYELVAGERRLRAATMAGLDVIPAYIREMSDEEAEDAQLAENIQRKNLTQVEEAAKIQRDLDRLGSVEAVLAKHQKSRSWLSKITSLLNLPEQAQRLVDENISADLEVINTVKTVEKRDPEAAAALVDDLKATRGKEDAREKAKAVKDAVKPKPEPKPVADKTDKKRGLSCLISDEEITSGKEEKLLEQVFLELKSGMTPKESLDFLDSEEKELISTYLVTWFDQGTKDKNMVNTVVQGLNSGVFGKDGVALISLIAFLQGAFLQGADTEHQFDLLNILTVVKK